jgi:hypothetical protein
MTLRGVVRQTWLRGAPAGPGAGRLVTPFREGPHDS